MLGVKMQTGNSEFNCVLKWCRLQSSMCPAHALSTLSFPKFHAALLIQLSLRIRATYTLLDQTVWVSWVLVPCSNKAQARTQASTAPIKNQVNRKRRAHHASLNL